MGQQGRSWLILLLVLFTACSEGTSENVVDQIRSVMNEQESAWDAGDIPEFMKGYHDSVCFISSRGTKCGRDKVTAQYLASYPDKEAMGDLQFLVGDVLPAGPEHAWCTGTWALFRSADTLSGGFSLLWQSTPEGWRILRDHTY